MGPPTFGNPIVFVSNSPSAALMLSIPRCQRTIEVLKERPAFEIFCIRNENILQWRWKISYWLQPATLIEPIFRGADFHNRISEKNSESTKGLKSNDNSCFSWVQKPKIQETRKGCQYLCNSCGEVCCSTGSTLQQGRSGKLCPIKKSGPAPLRDLMLRSLFKIHGWPSQYAPPGRPGGGLMRTNDFMSEVFSFKLTAKQEVWLPVCQ